TDDYFAAIDDLVDWGRKQPRTEETRREILDRYVGIVLGGGEVFRFLEQNRAAVQGMEAGKDRFARFRDRLDALVDLLAGPGAPLRERVRATAATLTVGATCHVYLQEVDDPDKLRAIILAIATDLIDSSRSGDPGSGPCSAFSAGSASWRARSRLCREATVLGSS